MWGRGRGGDNLIRKVRNEERKRELEGMRAEWMSGETEREMNGVGY